MINPDFELIHPPTNLLTETYSVGDIFNSNVYLGIRTKYRAWHLTVPSATMGRRELGCKVCLRFGQPSNAWVLIVNGEVKARNVGQMIDECFTICFKFCEQIFVITVKRRSSVRIRITMTMNGYDLKEIRKTTEISTNEAPPVRVLIPSARTLTMHGKTIAVYKVCCETNTKEQVAVERRYSDFQYLNTMVTGHTGQHLRPTLPKIPARVINPFYDQTNEWFINTRRQALESYLQNLLANNKVAIYTEVLCFLGLDPTTGTPLAELPSIDGAFTEQLFLDASNSHSAKLIPTEERNSQGSFTSVEMED